jgi:hypothetical protein
MPEPETHLLPIDAQADFGPSFVLPQTAPDLESEPDPYDAVETGLDPRVRQDFMGLLYLGRMEDECTIAGHKFLLRTPSQDDRLEMGPLHKPYLNTVTTEVAWRLITVAAYLRRIDSEPAPEPLNTNVSALRTRLEWTRNNIYAEQVIEALYDRCLLLDGRVREVITALDGQGES